MNYLRTIVALPPGPLTEDTVRGALELLLERFRWFRPVKFGRVTLDNALGPRDAMIESLTRYYLAEGELSVAAAGETHHLAIMPGTADHPYLGELSWFAPLRLADADVWRAAHARQLAELMTLVGSTLARAGVADDFRRKQWRWLPCPEGGEMREPTVRNYSEGLQGLYWRNFFGDPFVAMFGARLDALDPSVRVQLSGGIQLVQPYALPQQSETEEGRKSEAEFIAKLGPEHFYNHVTHEPPTRRPKLA